MGARVPLGEVPKTTQAAPIRKDSRCGRGRGSTVGDRACAWPSRPFRRTLRGCQRLRAPQTQAKRTQRPANEMTPTVLQIDPFGERSIPWWQRLRGRGRAKYAPKRYSRVAGAIGPTTAFALPASHRPATVAAVGALFFLPPALVEAWFKRRRRREDEQLLPCNGHPAARLDPPGSIQRQSLLA